MIIQQDPSSASYQINRYEQRKIWINQRCYENSVIISPHTLIENWAPTRLEDLKSHHFEPIDTLAVKILLLGTGEKSLIPPQELLIPLFQKGMGIEFMDNKAACYTYMVLSAEGRNVAACILISQ